ncbi:hypothetical protein B0H10DRAFT_493949 [Mycena sp. CBHHK59/15]|nr:hypothetical protein B0H10DRAFT_493949 [Mycena sp. CBHHK59/15]
MWGLGNDVFEDQKGARGFQGNCGSGLRLPVLPGAPTITPISLPCHLDVNTCPLLLSTSISPYPLILCFCFQSLVQTTLLSGTHRPCYNLQLPIQSPHLKERSFHENRAELCGRDKKPISLDKCAFQVFQPSLIFQAQNTWLKANGCDETPKDNRSKTFRQSADGWPLLLHQKKRKKGPSTQNSIERGSQSRQRVIQNCGSSDAADSGPDRRVCNPQTPRVIAN